MTPEEHELWTRIEAFELDVPDSALPFSARLARENQWSVEFTRRAIEEYKRFVFLAMCAGHPVSPSEEVDQVWHFHLTYTRSYWDELCGQILPRPLHHGPTRGGQSESAKFHDWYAQTLASYQKFFGEAAPPDWWPPARVRFGAVHWARVDTQRNWIIGKPQWSRAIKMASAQRAPGGILRIRRSAFADKNRVHEGGLLFAEQTPGCPLGGCHFNGSQLSAVKTRWSLALVALLLLMAGCDQVGQVVPVFDWYGPQFLLFYAVYAPVVLLSAYWWRRSLLPEAGDVGDHELPRDPYAIALLSAGQAVALQAALAELARRRAIEVAANGHIARTNAFDPTVFIDATAAGHPLEAAVLHALGTTGATNLAALQWDSGVERALKTLENQLCTQDFAFPADDALQARNLTLTLALLAPLVGIVKICVGMARDRPVGYLVILSALALLVTVLVFIRLPFRNARGATALLRLRLRHTNLKTRGGAYDVTSSAEASLLPLAVGLYGLQVLDQTPLADLHLRQRLQGASGSDSGSSGCGSDGGSSSGSSGCGGGDSGGSSCGGGGGGGGCGGCGGS